MTDRIRHAATVAMLLLAAGTVGCQSFDVVGAKETLPDGEGSPGFLDRISSQKDVSENDAMRGLLMLIGQENKAKTFKQRVDILLEKKIINPNWNYDARRPITKGRLAYMIYQACDFPGGIILALTGPSEHYCLRELQYQGVISSGTFYMSISGMEFVAVLNRADIYMQTGEIPDVIKTSWGR